MEQHRNPRIFLAAGLVLGLFLFSNTHELINPGERGDANSRPISSRPSPQATSAAKDFRVMSFNVHHGEGTDHKIDLARIAALIDHEHADVVVLQEAERGSQRLGCKDLVAELAGLLQMNYAFGKNFETNHAEHGNAVLPCSRSPCP